jgi:two-component system NtrC family sensor kinase
MPPLEQRFLELTGRFCATLSTETGFDTIVCDETGHIVQATVSGRVGDLHAGSQKIMRNEADEVAVTAAEAAADPRVREGVNIPIVVDGRRVGTFGLAGPPKTTRPVARIAAVVLGSWLEEMLRTAAASSLGQRERRRARVLCVDDSAATREHVKELLQGDYDVAVACDGVEALQAARKDPPDVVVCDYDMPRLNGFQLLLAMKADPALKTVPFIISTANTEQRTSARILDAGAHDFLVKSSTPEELKARVGAAVRSHLIHQEAQAERQELARTATLFARSEARTRAVLESSLDAILLLGEDGKIESMNGTAEKMFGWTQRELAGREFLGSLIAPRSRQAVAESATRRVELAGPAAGPGPRSDLHGLRQGGGEFPIECNFRSLGTSGSSGFCAFVRDLTEPRRMEVELQQAQKLEAVGRLAAGIAHEINTPIQFIGDNTHFLEDAFGAFSELMRKYADALPSDARDAMRSVEEEADLAYLREQVPKTIVRTLEGVQRVATIVRAMREFAHPDHREMVATDLNRSIQATLEVARNEYKYVADVETDLGKLPLVMCHAGDMNQVVLNIVINAAHAIADVVRGTSGRGKIRVSTRHDGGDVVVTISDSGSGIPEEVRHRIFEPFFTTKEVGRGTGQGLALARTIMAKHRGSIAFETEPGKGSTFILRVPVEAPSAVAGAADAVRREVAS